MVEDERADHLPHRGADTAALEFATKPGPGLADSGGEEILRVEPLAADKLAVEEYGQVHGPLVGREAGANPPVVLRQVPRQLVGGLERPWHEERHEVGVVDA